MFWKLALSLMIGSLLASQANANQWLYQCQFREKPVYGGSGGRAFFQWIYTTDPDYQHDFKIVGNCTKYDMSQSCYAVKDSDGKPIECNIETLGKYSVVR